MKLYLGSSSSGVIAGIKKTVSTTNATVTTIDTVPIPTGQMVMLTAKVVARKSTNDQQGFFDVIAGYCNNAGTVSIQGVVNYQDRQTQATWNVTFVISGTNVLIRVKGAAGATISWKCARQTLKV